MASVLKFIMDQMEEIKMKIYLMTVVLLDILISTLLVAQQQPYPHLWSAQIVANISNSRNEQMFYYAYTVTNSETNIGKIAKFEIDIHTEAQGMYFLKITSEEGNMIKKIIKM